MRLGTILCHHYGSINLTYASKQAEKSFKFTQGFRTTSTDECLRQSVEIVSDNITHKKNLFLKSVRANFRSRKTNITNKGFNRSYFCDIHCVQVLLLKGIRENGKC